MVESKQEEDTDANVEPDNPNDYLLKKNDDVNKEKQKKEYKPINTYKPSGNLLYNDEILNRIGKKLS